MSYSPESQYRSFCLQFTPPFRNHHPLPLPQPTDRIIDHLIHNRLCAFPLVHHGRRLAHEEGPCVVHGLVVKVVAQGFEIVLHRDDAFFGEVFDFLRAVLHPILDVRVGLDAEGAALWGPNGGGMVSGEVLTEEKKGEMTILVDRAN